MNCRDASSRASSRTLHTESSASPTTPPTSLGDDTSIVSEVTKMEPTTELREDVSLSVLSTAGSPTKQSVSGTPDSGNRRPTRSSRKSVATYNLQILAGTAIHTPTKYLETHHKKVLHGSLEDAVKTSPAATPTKRAPRFKQSPGDSSDAAEQQLVTEVAQAAQRRSSRGTDLRRQAALNLSGVGEAVANTIAGGKELVQRALKRSASDSRLRSSTQSAFPASPKRPRTAPKFETDEDEEDEEEQVQKVFVKPKLKQWMTQGLFVGQTRDFNARLSESQNRAKRKTRTVKENEVLPLPMFSYAAAMEMDPRTSNRDFKLPFDLFNPLPRRIKVEGWTKLSKNRFIGDASALWKRDKQDASQCFCEPEDGCGEACHNRIMAYECDETNCRLTEDQCGNRPFAQLKRRSKGNGYDYGVEVMETKGKGFGVRAMRTFDKHQIIVEYAGEIITQNECERRMKEVYKRDKCYYLMSFDNKMIIDATRGTIARFVNHSCEPNCEMIKWTVRGEPRMALFAGSRGIMSGEELTYDYNFDPFSTKNIQECHCGTESCRGVLGPKLKKPVYEERSLAASIIAGTKRKLQEVFSSSKGSESASSSPKKRKMGTSAMTKAMNAMAETQAAREKAKQDAAAVAAQLASREDRALKRNQAEALSKKSALRKTLHPPVSTIKSTRHATFSVRKVSKPGALKPVKRATQPLRPTALSTRGKKGLRPNRAPEVRATPEDSDSPVSSSEDESPNITPASLRSATKKLVQTKQLAQSKLNFKPLRFDAKQRSSLRRSKSVQEVPDSEEEDEDVEEEEDEDVRKAYVASNAKGKKRGNAPAPRSIHTTGAGVLKSLGGRTRGAQGTFLKKR